MSRVRCPSATMRSTSIWRGVSLCSGPRIDTACEIELGSRLRYGFRITSSAPARTHATVFSPSSDPLTTMSGVKGRSSRRRRSAAHASNCAREWSERTISGAKSRRAAMNASSESTRLVTGARPARLNSCFISSASASLFCSIRTRNDLVVKGNSSACTCTFHRALRERDHDVSARPIHLEYSIPNLTFTILCCTLMSNVRADARRASASSASGQIDYHRSSGVRIG